MRRHYHFHRSPDQSRGRRYVPAHRAHMRRSGPLIAFLLVASFGILFAGCGPTIGGPEDAEEPDTFTFTEEDAARFRELSASGAQELPPDSTVLTIDLSATGADVLSTAKPKALDLALSDTYDAIRSTIADSGPNIYSVTNEFLNVRTQPNVTAPLLESVDRGATVKLVEFVNAAWAKVELGSGRQGYVASRYISKVVAEDRLAEEKKAFDGLYFVNFGFLNVRNAPDAQSEKIGELSGQSFVRPLSMDAVWARILFEGKEGYVAQQYLSPFAPNFLVRQESFTLPLLHYVLTQETTSNAVSTHITRLKKEGYTVLTLRDFADLLLGQEVRDVRLAPKSVVLLLSGITPDNIQSVSDVLQGSAIRATLYIETQHVHLSGITEKTILTLLANGFDVQSATHTGDDLRSLVDRQVKLELEQSRAILEGLTKRPVFAVAYPYGGTNPRVREHARMSGYLFGVALRDPLRSSVTFGRGDFLALPAISVAGSATEEEVLKLVAGGT